ncbi:hypothetical protein D2V17_11845 [Aurantiacibacter xanthus]|uniref:Uncharacterized protein n=1 Tax=Aurantiacibacter xanthus TaxID=1784712 RepID=A0A3A1P2Q3_9SPHN|nr:hypothetical protein D2V17_11845 [Aurantiacibacter xanthus]
MTPARNSEEFEYIWVMEHFVLLLSTLFFAVGGAIDAISEVLGLADQKDQQDLLSRRLQALIEAMADVDPDDDHRFSAVVRGNNGEA